MAGAERSVACDYVNQRRAHKRKELRMTEETMSEIGARLSDLVRFYCEKLRNPALPPFVVYNPHTMTSWYATPESSKQGCYVFYSENGQVLYVGKASLSASMGSRLASHDRRIPRSPWRERAALVQFVAVTEPFEAASLEEFLIERLHPTGNIRGGNSN
jgi:hypothetical protein